MIFKLQRPLMCTGAPTMMIYNEDRSIEGQVPMSAEVQALFEDRFRIYAECHEQDTLLMIDHVVPDQNW